MDAGLPECLRGGIIDYQQGDEADAGEKRGHGIDPRGAPKGLGQAIHEHHPIMPTISIPNSTAQ